MLLPLLLSSHPADTNLDSNISDSELLAYVGASPEASLLQQAENIWKHGGSYETNAATGTTVFLPDPGSSDFVAIESYVSDPLSTISIQLPASLDDLTAHFYVSDYSSILYPAQLADVDGSSVIGLPPHPLTPYTGGTVYIALTEGHRNQL